MVLSLSVCLVNLLFCVLDVFGFVIGYVLWFCGAGFRVLVYLVWFVDLVVCVYLFACISACGFPWLLFVSRLIRLFCVAAALCTFVLLHWFMIASKLLVNSVGICVLLFYWNLLPFSGLVIAVCFDVQCFV